MKKIINIEDLRHNKEYDKLLEEFTPIWKKYWDNKEPVLMLSGQMYVSTRLLQLAIIADKDFKFLDKKCKEVIIKELEATIKLLK